MKLFCSTKLQKKLGCKLEKAPVPEDPLDYWYANVTQIDGKDLLLATIPDLRFCVLLLDVQPDQWADLNRLLVQAIRDTLRDQYTRIPLRIINKYLPENTVFELCATADRLVVSKMGAVTSQVLENDHFWDEEDFDPVGTQSLVNSGFYTREDGSITYRKTALLEKLQQRYDKTAPAMKLEISLDVPQNTGHRTLDLLEETVRRTLVVPADITFSALNDYLRIAMCWRKNDLYKFILPTLRDRNTELHICGDLDFNHNREAGIAYALGSGVLLTDYLKAGDCFRYLCTGNPTWELQVKVARVIPDAKDKLPVCTAYKGRSPLECCSGEPDYSALYSILQDKDDPRHEELLRRIDLAWFHTDCAEDVTDRLQKRGFFS